MMTPDKYEEEFIRLWEDLVPRMGEAPTVQGEMVRVIGRLLRECRGNGNLNWEWDSSFFRSMIDFLEAHLCGPELVDEIEGIREALCEAREYARCDAEPLHYLQSIVVDWCRSHPDPIPRSVG
jgi:hypothetical protein